MAFASDSVKRVRIQSYSGPHFSRIFPHLDWIRRDTEYLPVFNPNPGKSGKNADQNNSEYRLSLRSIYYPKIVCGQKFNLKHALSWEKRGFIAISHNKVKNTTKNLLKLFLTMSKLNHHYFHFHVKVLQTEQQHTSRSECITILNRHFLM